MPVLSWYSEVNMLQKGGKAKGGRSLTFFLLLGQLSVTICHAAEGGKAKGGRSLTFFLLLGQLSVTICHFLVTFFAYPLLPLPFVQHSEEDWGKTDTHGPRKHYVNNSQANNSCICNCNLATEIDFKTSIYVIPIDAFSMRSQRHMHKRFLARCLL